MKKETNNDSVKMKEYVDKRILSLERTILNDRKWTKRLLDNEYKWNIKYVDAEFKSVRDAVTKVETTTSDAVRKVDENNRLKFDAQNEWRQQFKDQVSTFPTRREILGTAVTIVTLILALAAIILTHH